MKELRIRPFHIRPLRGRVSIFFAFPQASPGVSHIWPLRGKLAEFLQQPPPFSTWPCRFVVDGKLTFFVSDEELPPPELKKNYKNSLFFCVFSIFW